MWAGDKSGVGRAATSPVTPPAIGRDDHVTDMGETFDWHETGMRLMLVCGQLVAGIWHHDRYVTGLSYGGYDTHMISMCAACDDLLQALTGM